ncbi:hypothetical protein RHMOL_Rhmol12G0088500 [Rhododendron molle]|uniref:Uncharacterized protein n=1 Tax=Rhododendron molle TaxID=49168 RepID=A0ACC0LH15_RHOML|nr:hypothetical protein RHMOL_Rhmol12G0088500 [Rhododendron molle]
MAFAFFLGLAHEVMDVSSDSDHSETEFERQLINQLIAQRRAQRRAEESVSTRMSATSAVSNDSNAEKDFEYDAEGYATEPEINFLVETESESEPQMGHEAQSRFTSEAEASTSALKDDDLFDKGLLCPYAHYFSGDTAEYEAFREKYGIPADVYLHRVKSDQIRAKREDRPEHITVPLMAICEAGLRFPFHPFLREVLWKFSLCPHQLAINSYRIIMSIIALIESQNLDFRPTNLFHTFTMSRHRKSNRRFLMTRPKKQPLIEGLSDADKWANFYLEVRGNFEFGETRNHPIPRFVDERELGPISKTLNSVARESACDTLRAQGCRHAPTLLDYEPSNKGVLRRKKKKKEGGPNEKDKPAGGKKPSSGATKTKRKADPNVLEAQPKRQRGVKLSRLGYTIEEWLSPLGSDKVCEPALPRLNIPLKVVEPSVKEMSRRGISRPAIPTKTSNPAARSKAPSDQQQREKRQKVTEDVPPPSALQPNLAEAAKDTPTEQQKNLSNPHIDLTDPQTEADILRRFNPSYTMPDDTVLLLKDSVKEEPNLAVTLLRGLALPRDCEQVSSELLPSLGEMCSHLVQTGQAALKAYDGAKKVQAERERYRTNRDSWRTKFRISETNAKELETDVDKLKKELADARAAVATTDAEMKKLKEEEKDKMRQADAKGYEAGIKRAALEYTQIAHKMVNDELEVRLPDFYKRGYAAGAEAMARADGP